MLYLTRLRRLLRTGALILIAVSPAYAMATRTILIFGDSLSAGYGIRQDLAWPALLDTRLKSEKPNYRVVNASISGETTAGGRSRLAGILKAQHPDIVILELGANDGLRGLPLASMRDNIKAMVETAQKSGAKVLLVGMRLPPNYGRYALDFEKSYSEIADKRRIPLVPFLLEGIADQPRLFQADMLHPTAEAQQRILETVWTGLSPMFR